MNLPLLSLFLSLSFPLIAPYHFYKATFRVQQKIEKYVNLINTTTVRKINLFRNTISNPFSHPLISLPTMEPPSLFHYQTKTKKDKKKTFQNQTHKFPNKEQNYLHIPDFPSSALSRFGPPSHIPFPLLQPDMAPAPSAGGAVPYIVYISKTSTSQSFPHPCPPSPP